MVGRRLGQQHRVQHGLVQVRSGDLHRNERGPPLLQAAEAGPTAASTSGSTSSKKWLVGTPTRTPARSAACSRDPAAVRTRWSGSVTDPDMVSNIVATSATDRPIGPTLSKDHDSGTTPRRGIRPCVGLRPTTPHRAAGIRIEPAVSVPMASGHCRAETAAADPPLDPPATFAGAQGFAVPGVDAP